MPPDPFVSSAQRSPWPRRIVIAAAVALALLLLAVAAVGGLAWHDRGRIPQNTTVAGVEVGGMTVDQARKKLRAAANARLDQPVVVVAPGTEIEVSGAVLGATPQLKAALVEAKDAGPVDRLRRRFGFGEKRVVPLRYRPDPVRVEALYGELADRFDKEPRSAKLRVTDAGVKVVPAVVGTEVNKAALARSLKRLPGTLGVPLVDVDPALTTAEAMQVKRKADRLLSLPRTIRLVERKAVLRAPALRRALRFVTTPNGAVAMRLDPASLRESLAKPLRRVETEPVDARFVVEGERVRVVPSTAGRTLDAKALALSLTRKLGADVHPARFKITQPSLTTARAKKLQIRELVAEFSTFYSCCQSRVTNIKRAAQLLDGTIIRPGKIFSMNDELGRRTTENGFVAAPQIFRGRLEDSVGGGISQVATTLYNAAFFSGIKLVQHQAHQFYISRYPMGREATVSWGGPELIFRNDWPAAILVRVAAWETGIQVRFYSAKLGRRVETVTGDPYDHRSPSTIQIANSSLFKGTTRVLQSAGASGFTVSYTRKVFKGPKLRRNEHYTVRYDPQNAYVEVGTKPKPKPKPKPKKGKQGAGDDALPPGPQPPVESGETPVEETGDGGALEAGGDAGADTTDGSTDSS